MTDKIFPTGFSEKTTPTKDDYELISDSADSNNIKKVKLGNKSSFVIGTSMANWQNCEVMQIENGSICSGQLAGKDIITLGLNYYTDLSTATDKYISNGKAMFIQLYDGYITFGSASSGLANGTITWNNAMYLPTAMPGTNGLCLTGNTDGTTQWTTKQDSLVSGTNIKTINSISLLGSGDIIIDGGLVGTKQVDETSIGNDKIIVYKTASGKLEYEAKPTGGGASIETSVAQMRSLI